MTEAVIVATARSPIGRANKGSLIDLRPDDMAAQIVRALMAKVPQVKGSDVEDLMLGIGQPAGEGGFNIGRMVAILAGLDDVPGVTVNRYCSSSLQTIRMAAHAINAGEGDCFIAAGVETVSRYASGASDMAPNPIFIPSFLRKIVLFFASSSMLLAPTFATDNLICLSLGICSILSSNFHIRSIDA